MNRGVGSSDFLIQATLTANQSVPLPKQNRVLWRVVAE
jgi:hypothetical protein